MRYLAVQREAVAELIADRLLQSTDYEAGARLADVLAGEAATLDGVSTRLSMAGGKGRSGNILFYPGATSRTFIVFDLEETQLFSRDKTRADTLLYLQRVLRFAAKYWDQRVMNAFEKVFPQYEKAIIFPYPISQKTNFRITVALDPDADRLQRRGQSERYLLAYRAGMDDGRGPAEDPPVAVFRKFLEDLKRTDFSAAPQRAAAPITTFQNVSVDLPPGRMDIHQGYDQWMRVLTDAQRRFVEAPLVSPARIEGPAGTGKTLCLALKAIYNLRQADADGVEDSSIFITHSEASRRSIVTVLESMGGEEFLSGANPRLMLEVKTLQGLCAELLHQEVSATELVDPDAYDAKQMQLLYVEEAISRVSDELPSYQKFFSPEFAKFLETTPEIEMLQMMQHEIAVIIKGRAGENYEIYKTLDRVPYGLPLLQQGDRAFVWRVFDLYREQLIAGGQFDTDDVTLSALSQLTTPIWRRRRRREGFDHVYVDETHLFNMNELSIFHHLTKMDDRFQIAFAVDRSQAIGDRGWGSDIDIETLVPDPAMRLETPKVRVASVFRCSPDIVNLAFSVTSSGASLFTNFEDPLALANSSLSFQEERICAAPVYREYMSDADMVDGAFERVDAIAKEMGSTRADVVLIAFSDAIFRTMTDKAERENKGVELLKERGNIEVVRKAKQSGRYLLTLPDYVGGLEFDGAVLVGVDDGRVPPAANLNSESRAFVTFAAHNRLYVAITRARYRVEILGLRDRGASPILKNALSTDILTTA